MSQLRSEIPFMASLLIRSGCDMKVDPSAEKYQVGVHFKALIEAILVAPSRILENFFFISCLTAALWIQWMAFQVNQPHGGQVDEPIMTKVFHTGLHSPKS